MQISTKHSKEVTAYSSCTYVLHYLLPAKSMTKLSSTQHMINTKNLLHEVAIACRKGAS